MCPLQLTLDKMTRCVKYESGRVDGADQGLHEPKVQVGRARVQKMCSAGRALSLISCTNRSAPNFLETKGNSILGEQD